MWWIFMSWEQVTQQLLNLNNQTVQCNSKYRCILTDLRPNSYDRYIGVFIFLKHFGFRKTLEIYIIPNFCYPSSLSGMRNCLRGGKHISDGGNPKGQKRCTNNEQWTYSVPLSTIWVSREMPSRLMNSWAKVMSRDALARSFRASSLASMLDDWIRSWSWTAVWY